MFRIIDGNDFVIEPIHEDMFEQMQRVIDGKDIRINENLCPRSAKTTLAKYLVVYTMTLNPRSHIIYTSFSQDLLMQIAQEIAAIMQHPVYKAMYPATAPVLSQEQLDPVDEFWKDYLFEQTKETKFSSRKITTAYGGVVLFASIGSAITGFGAGRRESKVFAGFLLCFPYDEQVWTENGRMAIGEIVEKKIKTRVWSYNFETQQLELRPITNWVKNPGDDLLEVSWNGASFRCTPDHKVWTLNRGYVAAKDLCSDDILACPPQSFDLCQGQASSLHNERSGQRSIHNHSKNISGQRVPNKFSIRNSVGKLFKRFSRFDVNNSDNIGVVGFGNYTNRARIVSDIDNIGPREVTSRKSESANLNSILHVFRFGAIRKIFQSIVGWYRIKVANFNTWCLWSNKSMHNCGVYHHTGNLSVLGCAKTVVSTGQSEVDNLSRDDIRVADRINNCSTFTANTSKIRNTVSPFVAHNGSPLLVRKVGHIDTSYCLTIGCNHNMIVGKTQGFLVKNCDDANKPADIRSETMRKKVHTYFVETLFTRLNSSNVPVINIQQRLHIEDLSGFLESVYDFKTFKHPLLDPDGNCTLPRQYTPERVAELQKDPYTFSAQYMQSPVIEGGNLIKTEWFRRFSVAPAKFDSLFIVADTAFTEKKSADNSAFGLFGTVGKDLYMVDGYCKKVIFPDLCRDMVSFYEAARSRYNNVSLSAIYIENKGSGISLIQQLREKGLPISELTPTVHNSELKKDQVADKYTRFMEVAADLESGYFHIPESAPWLLEFISECEAFTGGKQDAHDDFVDVAIYALKIRRKGMQTDWGAFKNNFMRRF